MPVAADKDGINVCRTLTFVKKWVWNILGRRQDFETIRPEGPWRVPFLRRPGAGGMRLMRPAEYPAPNPLSMLTVSTPPAQELSMLKSAVSPPKLAP